MSYYDDLAEQIVARLDAASPPPSARARDAALASAREYLAAGAEPLPLDAIAQNDVEEMFAWLHRANTAAMRVRIRHLAEAIRERGVYGQRESVDSQGNKRIALVDPSTVWER